MGWLSDMFGKTLQLEDNSEVARFANRKIPLDRIQFHIERYERAMEQCQKGGDRMAQLRKGREYWITMRSVHELETEL